MIYFSIELYEFNIFTLFVKSYSFIITILFLYYFLVQLPKFKIILIAACFFVVEGVDAHVDFLKLFGSIVEWGGSMLLSG